MRGKYKPNSVVCSDNGILSDVIEQFRYSQCGDLFEERAEFK